VALQYCVLAPVSLQWASKDSGGARLLTPLLGSSASPHRPDQAIVARCLRPDATAYGGMSDVAYAVPATLAGHR
jgi:hypothetical protein